MRISDLTETQHEPTDDPFAEYEPSEREATAYEKLAARAYKSAVERCKRRMVKYIDSGVLKQTTSKAKPRPGQDLIHMDGRTYRIDTKSPDEYAAIMRLQKQYTHALDLSASVSAKTLRSVSVMARKKRNRWPEGDAVVLGALKDYSTKTNLPGTDRNYFFAYFKYAVHTPWLQAEPYIARWMSLSLAYANQVYKRKRWQPLEDLLLAKAKHTPSSVEIATRMATYAVEHSFHRIPVFEPYIKQYAQVGYKDLYERTFRYKL